jgi:peptide/nickel transport system ATP-binding protein
MAGSGKAHLRPGGDILLTVEDLTVEFKAAGKKVVKAVSSVSFDVQRGETLAVVGESGCGKSTLGKALIQLPPPKSGSVVFEGRDLTLLEKDALREIRPAIQMIFQDPVSSLNPRLPISSIIDEPLSIWGRGDAAERSKKVDELLESVGLEPALVRDRKSYEFSGGQCQRISIARSLALEPMLLICDEPVSALDVSVQAQILNLLADMKERYGLTLIFISHDLAVVKAISTRIMVMYLGKICEVSTPDDLYAHPRHHYTHALISSVLIPDPEVTRSSVTLQGEPPSPMDPPSGCRFRTRCPAATDLCAQEEPQLHEVSAGHFVACHFPRP